MPKQNRLTPVSSRQRAARWPGGLAALAEQELHGVRQLAIAPAEERLVAASCLPLFAAGR